MHLAGCSNEKSPRRRGLRGLLGLVVHVPLDVVIDLDAYVSDVPLNTVQAVAGRAAMVGLELSLHGHLRFDNPSQATTDGYKN